MKGRRVGGPFWSAWAGTDGETAEPPVPSPEEAMARDHDIETSARIQRTLLAGRYDFSVPGLEIAAETLPSSRVDGDFYDFFPLSNDSLDFMIGDVMGKGIPAALTAAAAKSAVYRSLMRRMIARGGLPEPDDILAEVDRVISGELVDMGKFLTMYYCRVEPQKASLRFIDAGHTSFLYHCARDKTCWTVKGANMPLGFTESQSWQSFTLPVDEGDTIFFYSDGISEAENAQTGIFGEERLRQLVLAHAKLAPEELVKQVLALTFYYSEGSFRDDVTALALRMRECGMPSRAGRTISINRPENNWITETRTRFLEDLEGVYRGRERELALPLSLALVEALGNLAKYTSGPASVYWDLRDGRVSISLDCLSGDFDWFRAPQPQMDSYPMNGYGSWIMSGASDSILLLRGRERQSRIIITKDVP